MALFWSLFAWSGGIREPLKWRARQMRALVWLLLPQAAWAHPTTVVKGRNLRAWLWPLFARLAWAKPATLLAGTTGEGAALASVRSVGVYSACHSDGGHDI
jgi:hypothetical protein